MNDTLPPEPAEAWRRQCGLANLVATWSERLRVRRQLQRKLTHNPHLIDDIGLTRRQAEAEIAKPFWRP